jgi:hypothetical protein
MNTEVQIEATTDSFDPNIVPAETKARIEREGSDYKQTPDNSEDADSIHTADGYTVDTEGLVNNYAVEPPMYIEEVGALKQEPVHVIEKFTIADIFPNSDSAENVATEIHNTGISRGKISVLGKDYQNSDHGFGSLNWQDIKVAGGLKQVLVAAGIAAADANKYETAIAAGSFLVVIIGEEDDVVKAKEVLLSTGHRVSDL